MTILQELRKLQEQAQAAYETGLWTIYDKATDEYIRIEDENCTCPKRLLDKSPLCPCHGDVQPKLK